RYRRRLHSRSARGSVGAVWLTVPANRRYPQLSRLCAWAPPQKPDRRRGGLTCAPAVPRMSNAFTAQSSWQSCSGSTGNWFGFHYGFFSPVTSNTEFIPKPEIEMGRKSEGGRDVHFADAG